MGLPEKSDSAAGSDSDELSITREKRRGVLLIFILPEKSAGVAGSD